MVGRTVVPLSSGPSKAGKNFFLVCLTLTMKAQSQAQHDIIHNLSVQQHCCENLTGMGAACGSMKAGTLLLVLLVT